MTEVTKRELNQQTASVLASVVRGRPVTVTERGRPRWRIEEIDDDGTDAVAVMVAAGRLTLPSKEPAPWGSVEPLSLTPAEIDAAVDEIRADR